MSEIQGKHAELSIVRPEALQQIAHALSSPVRLEIMRVLGGKCMNVGEIAAAPCAGSSCPPSCPS